MKYKLPKLTSPQVPMLKARKNKAQNQKKEEISNAKHKIQSFEYNKPFWIF